MPLTREQHQRWPSARRADGRRMSRPLAERLWEKVDRSGGSDACWIWIGAVTTNGYGQINTGGRKSVAHRAAWELVNGPVPLGKELCHRCDNRKCVNLAHLFVGTRSDNVRDCVSKGRHVTLRGEASLRAKLSDEQVREIRALWDAGGFKKTEIGRRFGISSMYVFRLVTGQNRKCA